MEAVRKLNEDPTIHGILVQLPLPDQCDEPAILKEIAVHKDADGFSVRHAPQEPIAVHLARGSTVHLVTSIHAPHATGSPHLASLCNPFRR
eukprot:COSAG02_NODE_1019_length_15171_cov_7.663482_21_plen_91_part_00